MFVIRCVCFVEGSGSLDVLLYRLATVVGVVFFFRRIARSARGRRWFANVREDKKGGGRGNIVEQGVLIVEGVFWSFCCGKGAAA